jgi:glycosyltransferase involved in cell wall biosynthesis
MQVTVLLSTYNGEKYLSQQIESVLAQQGVEVKFYVRDDGSKDGTCDILEHYAQKGLLEYEKGENLGFAKSFFTLLRHAPKGDYYAFCDQDDYWHPDKLISAVNALNTLDNSKPNLYYSALRVVDRELKLTHESTHENYVPPSKDRVFPSSLMQNWVYGCTMVFNEKLRQEYLSYGQELYCHDWTMYQIAAALGNVYFDPVPHIDYRQHGNNVYGFFKSGLVATFKNLKLFFTKEAHNLRLKEAIKFKAAYYDKLSAEQKVLIDKMVNYKNSAKDKNAFKNEKAFWQKGIIGFYHKTLLFLGRL